MDCPLPANEAERLRALRDYAILNTPPEETFDDLTQLAAALCQSPIALISLVDEDRQWFKSRVGISASETARDISFCTHAILQPDLFIVPDASQDPRFATNPLVTTDPHIKFYAGAPLINPEGFALGTLCVIDHVPRELTAEQKQAMVILSRHVITQLELRRAQAARSQAEQALRERDEMVQVLRQQLQEKAQAGDLIGKTKAMQRVYNHIHELSRVDTTVLIEGETGTGKELVASAIHAGSHRQTNPFIAVNCAGLTESLVASQLFGHKKGAFTGAIETHQGVFEAADGGTLFLDEIGDIPLPVQANLLRVLQEKEVTRIGETKPRKVDVRVLTATHHDLAQDVKHGGFRADLFYRIRVARIQLPPLRARREDIPLLVLAFLREFRATLGKAVQGVSDQAMQRLIQYSWPGNVRELRGAIEYAAIHCQGPVIQGSDLPPEIQLMDPEAVRVTPTGQTDKEMILAALKRVGGNRKRAAPLLGMSRATLYRRLKDLHISPEP